MIDGLTSWWDFVSQRWDEVFEATLQTAQMVALAMAIGTVICIVLGVIAHRVAWLREPLLAVASVAITIPSLALFAIFIPVVGIGNTPAIIALVIYSLMPILRNTITGLDGVDPAVVEAAKGVGLFGGECVAIGLAVAGFGHQRDPQSRFAAQVLGDQGSVFHGHRVSRALGTEA